jgi:LPXTG-motif cell wall-anchored protein
VSASDSATAAGGVVTWSGLPSLAPGEQKLLTVEVRMDDVSQPSYINVAEITDDSSAMYSAAGDPVTDVDSAPDADPSGDPYADTDDISTTPSGDEDDHDRALIDPAEVAVDNLSPVPPTQPTSPPATIPDPGELPRTGGNSSNTALIACGILLAGIALVLVRRRAPRRRAH